MTIANLTTCPKCATVHTLTTSELPSFTHSYTPAQAYSAGAVAAEQQRRLIDALDQNMKLTSALREFIKVYQRHEREWDDEFRETDEFLDWRDAYDRARAALLP